MAGSLHAVSSALVCLFAGASGAWGQQAGTSATLGGLVTDATGAVVIGVSVSAGNRETGRDFHSQTDPRGRYQFLHLAPGLYSIRVDDARFQHFERLLTLTVGQALDLPVTLELAGRRETVQVAETPVLVEAARSGFAATVTSPQIDLLPLNGRNYLDLALLVPGVSRTNTGAPQQFAETSAVPGTGISVSGQRNLNNAFVVDGVSANDDAAGLAGTFFSQEVIREFQVVTSGANAEFGRASSGVINIATRSGTNQWHGRAYGFLRNRRFDARNALATGKDPLTQTQYGVTAGGPIVRGRTFLFSNFERTQRNAAGFVTISAANTGAVNQALERFGYAGPRVTTGEFPTGWDMSNYFVRLDHQLNDRNQFLARYSLYDIVADNARSVGGLSAVSRGTRLDNRDQSIAASEISTLSPHLLNEARFQFTRSRLSAPGNDLIGPAVSIAGVANFGASTTSPAGRDLDFYELDDTLSLQRGKHFLKVGAGFLLNRLNIYFPGSQVAAAYNFASLAAFQAGAYATFQQSFGDAYQFQSNPNASVFVEDDWKVTPNLMLSLGARYDIQKLPDPIRTDRNNLAPRFGMAWSPSDRKTVVRANYGLFYDRIPLRATSNALQRDGTKYRTALLAFGQAGAPVFPSQLTAFPAGQYINISTIDPRIENSYSHQAGVQIERTVGAHTVIGAGYQRVRTLHLILSRNANVPSLSAAQAAAQGVANLGRPDSRYGNVSRYEGSGDAYYNGLLLSLRARPLRGTELVVSYTLSKAIDDTGNFFFSSPQDSYNLRDDRGLSDNDQRHRLTVASVLQSPVLSRSGLAARVLNSWALSLIFRYTSALPYNVQLNFDRNYDTNLNDRPVGVGRNTGLGFNFASLDARLTRSFRITERIRLDALAEGFNTLNRVNPTLPNNIIGAGSGTPLASFGRATAVFDPRQLQFGFRMNF